MEIVKEKISERKGENPKTLAIEYKKNNEKQENLEYTQKRKAQKTLDWNLNENDGYLVNILIDLEQSKSFFDNEVIEGNLSK